MPQVRGKFKVTKITKYHYSPKAAEVVLDAVYSGSPEDNTYAEATPTGSITMFVSNPAALEVLEIGKSFYIDFTAVEEQPANGQPA